MPHVRDEVVPDGVQPTRSTGHAMRAVPKQVANDPNSRDATCGNSVKLPRHGKPIVRRTITLRDPQPMPVISRFLGIVIVMLYRDHEPPHPTFTRHTPNSKSSSESLTAL